MAVQYDHKIIITFAEGLYAQAATLVQTYVAAGVLLGLLAGAGVLVAASAVHGLLVALIVGGILGWLFYKAAQAKAFALRLQAQTALCQVQIEENTRRG